MQLRDVWIVHFLPRLGDIKTHALYREIKQHIETKKVESLSFSRMVIQFSAKCPQRMIYGCFPARPDA